MTKKVVIMLLVVAMILVVATVPGCKKTAPKQPAEKKLKVTLYINGTLGDKGFFDSAERGLKMAISNLDIDGKTVEGGVDPSKWEPDLEQLSQGDSDIIIVGTWQMTDALTKIAPKYPDKKYIIFDSSVDYSKGNLGNVYSMLYKQNEGSFLVGALAAMVTSSKTPLANKEKIIGFVGGMDIPVINDFKVGYIQGVHFIDPNVKVLVSYAGTFTDPAKGKELALAQYDQGADVVFNVAGQTGLGVLAAAKEANRYSIGVDSDQYILVKDNDPEEASHVITSMMKNVDNSIYRALKLYKEGTLKFGAAESLGIKEGGVGVADNENYEKIVPKEFRDKVKELETKIINGEIKVDTAFGG